MKINNIIKTEYEIIFSPIETLGENLGCYGRRILLLIDDNVEKLWGQKISTGLKNYRIEKYIVYGERSKTVEIYLAVIAFLTERGFGRGDAIVAAGGGATGDLGGFAAMTYMRGMDFYNLPTTLLSMCDSCLGSKNGVNLGYKNYIGGFFDPKLVFIDTDFLSTLPEKHYRGGFGEIIKTALLFDGDLVEKLELKSIALKSLIYRNLELKAAVVNKDYFDSGLRRVLNYGHTFGHAIEGITGLHHGEAVAAGISIENKLAVKSGIMESALAERIDCLLTYYGFEADINILSEACRQNIGIKDRIMKFVVRDKKNSGGKIILSLLSDIGVPRIAEYTTEEIEDFLLKL